MRDELIAALDYGKQRLLTMVRAHTGNVASDVQTT